MDERGGYNPELASITFRDAVRKGWVKRPERCPPFWRPALRKVLAERDELVRRAALAQRLGITDSRAAAMHKARLEARERHTRDRFPNLFL